MSSSDDILDNEFAGFGRRTNGTCEEEETDCGTTKRDQSACCPKGMFCTGDTNTVCCPTDDDCTKVFTETPRCADKDWNMYNNTVPFCCSDDAAAAFKTGQNSNICADEGFQPLDGDHTLPKESQVDDRSDGPSTTASATPLSSLTSAGSSSTGEDPAEGSEASSSGESNNVGAIAGGVVGGVVGLALILLLFWYLRRKQNKKQNEQQKLEGQQGGPPQFSTSDKGSTPNQAVVMAEKDASTREPEPTELENPERADLMGYYRTTSHQQPGERAELT